MNYIHKHCGIFLCHKTNMSRSYRIHFCATPDNSSQLSDQILRETVYRLTNQIKLNAQQLKRLKFSSSFTQQTQYDQLQPQSEWSFDLTHRSESHHQCGHLIQRGEQCDKEQDHQERGQFVARIGAWTRARYRILLGRQLFECLIIIDL